MAFDFSTLVIDRKGSDLDTLTRLCQIPMNLWTAEQLDAFNAAAMKGAYDYTDLNRVTACLEELDGTLTAMGYATGFVPVVIAHKDGTTDTVWQEADDPTLPQMDVYLGNVARMRGLFSMPDETPVLPEDLEKIHWTEANAVEAVLLAVERVIRRIRQSYLYSGEAFSGEFTEVTF